MAKALDYNWDLPYTPQALFEQGTRRDFNEAQAKTLGHYDFELLTLQDGPEGGRATATYEIDVDVPNWAKKMVPARAKVTETRSWGPAEADGSRAYLVLLRIDQLPIEIKGKVTLVAKGSSTENTVHMDIKAGIPVFGVKLEEMVVAELSRSIEGERDFVLQWMKRI